MALPLPALAAASAEVLPFCTSLAVPLLLNNPTILLKRAHRRIWTLPMDIGRSATLLDDVDSLMAGG
jgi:hypothetical protein